MAEKIEVIAELKDLISGKFKEINSQIDAMDSKLSNVSGRGGGGLMGAVLGANLLTNAIMGAGRAIKEFAIGSAQAFGRAEQFQTSLKTLLYGNAQQANILNDQLKQFAIETPFELSEVQQATRLMIAYGSSATGVVDEMRMLGDVSAGTAQPLNEIAYLYGTIRQQQVANHVDLKQFANRGIPIFKELAKVTSYSLQQLVEGGKDVTVTFKDVEAAFKNMTSKGSQFGGMMGEQAKTLLGQTSNLSDAWEQLQVAIGQSQSGILKDTVQWVTDMVNEMRKLQDTKNFRATATAGLDDAWKIKDESGFMKFLHLFSTRSAGLSSTDIDADRMFTAFNPETGERKMFQDQKLRDKFLEYNQDSGFLPSATVGTGGRFKMFSGQMFGEYQKVLQSKDQVSGLADFFKKLHEERGNVLSGLQDRSISSVLGKNMLTVIDKLFEDAKGLQAFQKQKKSEEEAKAKEPKKLEEVAKQNKAVQVIVNIENLVNELVNNVGSPKEALDMSTERVSRALLAAVNDIYAVGL